VVSNSSFMNSTQYPSNAAHDMFGLFGFLNVTRIEHNMLTFLTNPHFFNTGYDPSEHFEGDICVQDPELHQTFVYVEPNLGKTLKATKRLQVSFLYGPIHLNDTKTPHVRGNPWFKHVKPAYFPIAWFQEAGTISDSQADDFKNNIYFAQNLAWSIKWIGAVFGGLILFFACLWWWRHVCSPRQPDEMHTQIAGVGSGSGSGGGGGRHDEEDVEDTDSHYVRDLKQPTSEAFRRQDADAHKAHHPHRPDHRDQ